METGSGRILTLGLLIFFLKHSKCQPIGLFLKHNKE